MQYFDNRATMLLQHNGSRDKDNLSPFYITVINRSTVKIF